MTSWSGRCAVTLVAVVGLWVSETHGRARTSDERGVDHRAFEPDWDEPGLTAERTPVCGDGLLVGDEACDDGNDQPGDGCSEQCAIEDGYACDDAEPSVCAPDGDGDTVPDVQDNCPATPNTKQRDLNRNGLGDACDRGPSEPFGQADPSGCHLASSRWRRAESERPLALGTWLVLLVAALARLRRHRTSRPSQDR